jgi:hypothetical protein
LNHRDIVVTAIGKEGISHIYDLADIYHCENIDKITEEFIQRYHIPFGSFDNVTDCQYHVPTHCGPPTPSPSQSPAHGSLPPH